MTGGTYGGAGGYQYGGLGATYGTAMPAEPEQSLPRRGAGYGGPVGAAYGNVTTSQGIQSGTGGTYGVSSESIDSLIDTGGFVVVLETPDGNRTVFTPDAPATHSIQSLDITLEVNNMSDWRIEVPPDPGHYDLPFADVAIGYDGDRIFHGTALPVEGAHGDSLSIGGFGPLWWAKHGRLELTYPQDHPDYPDDGDGGEFPAWRCINDLWKRTARAVNGRVRGYALRPDGDHLRMLPAEGQDFSGTPLSVLKELHGYAGMAFALDHSDPSAMAVSFTPGRETRSAGWRTNSYDADLDPKGYHNRVVVRGAEAPDSYPYPRYRGVAQAPESEINDVANGRVLEYTENAFDLTTPLACEERAKSVLVEHRSNYSISGSVTTTPVRVTPGYTYRVSEFDAAAPELLSPVWLPLQSVTHTFAGTEASSTLKFETPDGVVEAIREQVGAPLGLDSVQRRIEPVEFEMGFDAGFNVNYDQGDSY